MASSTEPTTFPQQVSRSYTLPRHLRQPGEDGYRTPVIEDPEHPAHNRHRNVQSAHSSSNQALNPPGSRGQTPQNEKNYQSHEGDRRSLPEGFPKNISWRQRLKHTTWAYFTLTMATGGIRSLINL